jgi:hypothetical protein
MEKGSAIIKTRKKSSSAILKTANSKDWDSYTSLMAITILANSKQIKNKEEANTVGQENNQIYTKANS